MKNSPAVFFRIAICLLLALGAYLWVNNLMESLYGYRSPLSANPPSPGNPLAPGTPPPARRVVFVLIDALRADTAWDAAMMPYLNELRQQGAWATMHSRPPSYSAPSYTVLMTGAWPEISDGPALNPDSADIPAWTQDNLFAIAHRAGLRTAAAGFIFFDLLIPDQDLDASFFTFGEDHAADLEVMQAAMPWLRSGDYQFVLIHIDQVDYAGHHEGGPGDRRWNQAARRADDLLRQIVAELDLSQDVVLIASDHGHIDAGGHGGDEPVTLTEPFVLLGAGVQPGAYGDIDMVDVAPTLAILMGGNLPATSQGRVRSEMLSLPSQILDALPSALYAQQSQLLQAYQRAIGRQASPEQGEDIVGAHQAAMQQARQARLWAERLPRLILALVLVLGPLVWLWWAHRGRFVWYLAAGIIYLATFNLYYAVLGGRTYSLSSVISAENLILYCAVGVLVALPAGLLVLVPTLQIFRRSPVDTFLVLSDGILAVIYLTSLPSSWSLAVNGVLISWSLPDFGSMYLGFLALIQIAVLSVFGLLLSGLATLISWARKHSQGIQQAG